MPVYVLQSIYRFAVLLLFLTQFAMQQHSILLQNTFLFFFFCDLVKKKMKQNTGILPCLLFAFGIDSASLSFATTSLRSAALNRKENFSKAHTQIAILEKGWVIFKCLF